MKITEKLKQNQNEGVTVEKAQVEYPPATFTNLDQVFLVLSIVAYILNKIIDVVLIHTYLSGGHLVWGLLTVLVVLVPQALVHLISYRWHVHDQEATTSLLVVHCCQLGVFLRLVAQFSDGRRWRRSKSHDDSMLYLQQSSDVSLLLLFLGYLESAPQLLLQVHVTSTEDGWQLVQGVSAVLSLLSLAWSNASYAKWMRRSRGDKLPLGWMAALLQLLWRLCLLLARVSALLCCSLLLGGWLLPLLAAHWLLMTGWVLTQRTDLFPSVWEERLFNAVVGGIYCFSFFNVKETPARWRMLAFYSLVFTENVVMATLFFFYWPRPSDALYTVVLSNVAGGTVLGTLFMLLYYAFLHPAAAGNRRSAAPRRPRPRLCCWGGGGGGLEEGVGGSDMDVFPAGDPGGTLRSLKCRAANRISVTSLRSAGGVSLTSQPERVTSQPGPVTSAEEPEPELRRPVVPARDKPFHSASELLDGAATGHVTRSAASLPARRGHVTAAERRNQSASAVLQLAAVSAEAHSATPASLSGVPSRVSNITPGRVSETGPSRVSETRPSRVSDIRPSRVSDIPQLDAVSEGDITLPSVPPPPTPPPPPAAAAPPSSDGDSTTAHRNLGSLTRASPPQPDYENVSTVGVFCADLGLRAWRAYSDVGDSAHDFSVVTERAGRLDVSSGDSVLTEATDAGGQGGRHTYENTDNVALMIAHMEDGEKGGVEAEKEGEVRDDRLVGRGGGSEVRRRQEEEVGAQGDASLLVTTIDAVERSGVSALFSTPPRRSRSTDDLASSPAAASATARARRRLLNTSFDPGLLVALPSDGDVNYKCPRSPPEAIYARPTKGGGERGSARRLAEAETRRSKTALRRHEGDMGKTAVAAAAAVAVSSAGHRTVESHVSPPQRHVSPLQRAGSDTAARGPPGSGPAGVRPAGQTRSPLSAINTPTSAATATGSPRRKFSVLRSRFEPPGRRYAVTPAGAGAGAAVSRRPSLQAAARALWTGKGRRSRDKENAPPTPPPAMSPIDL